MTKLNPDDYQKRLTAEFERLIADPRWVNEARRLLRDDARAADAVQTAGLKLWRNLTQNPSNALTQDGLQGLMHRSLRRVCIDFWREQKRLRASAMPADNIPSPPIEGDRQLPARLHAALNSLDQDARKLLIAVYLEGRDRESLAQELRISPEALYKRLSRAREQLLQAIRKLL